MIKRNIIVIGASAGGFAAIRQIVADLPKDLDASIFVVWHISPNVTGILPDAINRIGTLHASHGIDGTPIRSNHIYVAQPDFHMLVQQDKVRISHGPKENRFRPAIDPLFRSAAHAFGPRVIGVILSGALDDGTAGLWSIKQHGGLAVVQAPEDAEVSSMPESAINAVPVDHIEPVHRMGQLLARLVNEPVDNHIPDRSNHNGRTELEIKIAMEEEAIKQNIMQYGELTPYTCPECHGVLAALHEGDRVRFRCHTGHAFSSDSLLASITEKVEESISSAIRNVRESVILLNHLGDHHAALNEPKLAATFFKKAGEAEKRVQLLRQAIGEHEQLSEEGIRQQAQFESNNLLRKE